MLRVGMLVVVAVLSVHGGAASVPSGGTDACYGEFSVCPDGSCVLDASLCGSCASGQYLCPMSSTCVSGAKGYFNCPGLKGTHLDWTLDVDTRLAYLASRVNTSRQIMQLQNTAPAMLDLGIPFYNFLNDDEHGVRLAHATVFPDGPGLGASFDRELLYQVGQAIGVEARGGHGHYVHHNIRGQPDGPQAFKNGVGLTLYSPNLNLVTRPTWGRAQEVLSECPTLSGFLTVQFIRGMQGAAPNGDMVNSSYLLAGACCKHFAAYDVENIPQSRFTFDARVDTRNMWETYLPVFDACINDAKAMHVMCSYNSLNGIPTCADKDLMNGLLRDTWEWPGFVVSDYDAWANILNTHKYVANMTQAAAAGINAGLDQEGGGTSAVAKLPDAVADGSVSPAAVEASFKRLFRARINLGLLDPPTLNPYNAIPWSAVESAAHQALARRAAGRGMCLYKNTNATLPLSVAAVNVTAGVAVVGPLAASGYNLEGNYARQLDTGAVSVLDGLVAAVAPPTATRATNCSTLLPGMQWHGWNNQHASFPCASVSMCCASCTADAGCSAFTFDAGGDGTCYKFFNATGPPARASANLTSGWCPRLTTPSVVLAPACTNISCADTSLFAPAVAAAAAARVTVAVLGTQHDCRFDVLACESESWDRAGINLVPNQYKLASALAATGTPLVCVLVHGGSVALRSLMTDCDAVVDAWFPGSQGGNGVADVLFGRVNPAGRTPQTYYVSDDVLPPAGLMNLSAIGLTYRYADASAVELPFGHGLSYSTFAYSNMTVSASTVAPCDAFNVTVDVRNTAGPDGDEVAQVYVQQPAQAAAAPRVLLADFARVHVPAGATVTVTLTVHPKQHVVVDAASAFWSPSITVEAGPLDVWVGPGQPSDASLHATVTVSSTAPIGSCL